MYCKCTCVFKASTTKTPTTHMVASLSCYVTFIPCLQVPASELRKLLVHSIPTGTTFDDIRAMFAPLEARGIHVEDAVGDLEARKVHVLFKHAGDANAAFKQLSGSQQLDSGGRATKAVTLSGECGCVLA